MDYLSDDLLLNISKRVAKDGAQTILSFMRTNKRHEGLCRTIDVLRAFNNEDAVRLLNDLKLTHEKLAFMHRLWASGHHTFCLLRCTQFLLHATPCLQTMRELLQNAEDADSLSAKYFALLLRALSWPPMSTINLFADFREILMTRQVARCRREIIGGDTNFWFQCGWHRRPLPAQLVRRCFCNNWHNCPRDGRPPHHYYGYLPTDDDEYRLDNFCINGRLNSEINWMIEIFGFSLYY